METFFIATTVAVFVVVIAYKIGYARARKDFYIPPIRTRPAPLPKDYYESGRRK